MSCSNNNSNENKIKKLSKDELDSIRIENSIANQKVLNCNIENAERNFKSWLEFKYPDWKIISDLKIQESGDCEYDIRFTVLNPYLSKYVRTEEIVVVRISFVDAYEKYSIKFLRGVIY